ncbi:hypothetical protein CA85_30260 [Allorhodopirellula solitaria]|uniref:Uncharacterized protein n=1 Tax=Allorhodopirellula solitaria TaxID=2527987 RepID=A0A5C5XX22_9BACT|nr:hypothetical protein CA85_30260 [Allorhodopirellula solitaria]
MFGGLGCFSTVLCAFVSVAADFYEAATETNTPSTFFAKKNEVEQSVGKASGWKQFWCAGVFSDGDLCGASVRGPWRQLNGPWRVHRSRGCPFARRLAAPTTASLACLASLTCERYREILARQLRTDCAFDVLRPLVDSCDIWDFDPWENSLEFNASVAERQHLPPPCKSFGRPRSQLTFAPVGRLRTRSLACSRSGVRHPASRLIGIHASVHSVDVPPSMATHRLRSRRPVSARSLRCGLRSSQSLLTAPSLRCRRSDPAVPTSASLRWPSVSAPPGGILPPGLVMRRHPCRRRSAIYPGRRHPAETAATHFVCVGKRTNAPAASCRRYGGPPVRQRKTAAYRLPFQSFAPVHDLVHAIKEA